MKIKTTELIDKALDWAVAKCEGGEFVAEPGVNGIGLEYEATRYSTDWAQGGPIIERELITSVCAEGEYSSKLRGYKTLWVADIGRQCASDVYGSQGDDWGRSYQIGYECMSGPTLLVAAMRCYVASELGNEVDVPEELL